ncbi:DNAJ heat shock N-terminal domain-containing protein [Artemisia annua]|uniref:DNAJ heat shock N-terminal domain-containing protein n=1 Tax=Artemisia annua TaxID=35608 RepID=A0A2U1Q2Q0_ARTAN|nr:DNAJ heat shock N-terminal domain-containing protein [Artemisia annua]
MWKTQLFKKPQFSTIILKTINPQTISPQLQNPQRIYPNFTSNTKNQTRVLPKPQIWKYDFTGKFCTFSGGNEFGRCWNCKSEKGFLICESCGCVQPVDQKVDYFSIFGLERRFDIDDGSLEGTYKNWQKKLHPDLVHTKSKEEREYAAEQSARVIDAYTTLRKPLKRAIYIMRLEGVEVDEEQTVSEPELLGEIMEIREAVEEASDSQALNKIHSQMEEKLSHWSDTFGNAFGSKKYDEALKAIQRMTYYHRVNEEIVKKL